MFENLSKSFTRILDRVRNRGLLTDLDVDKAMREIRVALLEADVGLSVATEFIEEIKKEAIGQNIIKNVSPGQMVAKIVYDQLINYLGKENQPLKLKGSPKIILLVGLQGSGKTTTAAKLALKLKDEHKILMVSLDVYRPAAKEQLEQLGTKTSIDTLPIVENEKPLAICERAIEYARINKFDLIVFDTAGRLHIAQDLMDEAKKIQDFIKPSETLLVADAMTGQDAVNIAKAFSETLKLTGIILTRVDGDARGGAALSMKKVTGCPIKFMGVGEKVEELESFDPERVASRILDMGDVLGLVEKATKALGDAEADRLAKKMEKGRFDLNDMLQYLHQMENMGGISGLMQMLPGIGRMKEQLNQKQFDDKILKKQIAIIRSMTQKERRDHKILSGQRKKRIALGSGTDPADVNKLIKQYEQVKMMMKQFGMFSKGGFPGSGMFGSIKNMFGI